MKRWYNRQHLQDAGVSYFQHMWGSLQQAGVQFVLFWLSIVHAIFPFIGDWQLLRIVVRQAIQLYRFVPDSPVWRELRSELEKKPDSDQ